ncbi:Allophanate hydrolase 2 subunit 1 [Serinicoccus hydrothermalis]|uniref:Allophanate hydrolase 2 subunit 1 n=1 Tax=Serinicoccus hydrothermalis TaxID=1758689 RepID=A0A1B1NAT1_9MICO|nr:Allophanate hydrolase 2 subunit 1 [Serinicoccus hydrothermalis]
MELDDLQQVLALHAALEQDPPTGVTDLVPAARTLLLLLDPARTDVVTLADQVRSTTVRPGAAPEAGEVEIPVVYDGEDLAEVAELTSLSTQEVVAAHTGQEWTVAFCGFAPGFGYLVGEDRRLHVPRRSTPRKRVPAGAVGLAGEFGGVYPRESPGGWQLIGRTDATLWDVDRDPPALLTPGVRVRFVEARS